MFCSQCNQRLVLCKCTEYSPINDDVLEMIDGIARRDLRAHPSDIVRLVAEVRRLKYKLNHQTEDDVANCERGLHRDCGKKR